MEDPRKIMDAAGDMGAIVYKGLEALAKNHGKPLETVWGWALKQNTVYLYQDYLWITLGVIIAIVGIAVLIWVARSRHGNAGKDWDNNEAYTFIVGAVLLVGGGGLAVYFGLEAIARSYNPDWMTIKDLLHEFEKLVNPNK
jgi:hypothetical protein